MYHMIKSALQRPNSAGLDFIKSEILINSQKFKGEKTEVIQIFRTLDVIRKLSKNNEMRR